MGLGVQGSGILEVFSSFFVFFSLGFGDCFELEESWGSYSAIYRVLKAYTAAIDLLG